MSMQNIPMLTMGVKFIPILSNTLLDGANERVAHCGYFTTPDGATRHIEAICWATGTVTTGDDILCQIESIDTSTGLPNGIIATGVSGTQTVGNSDDNIWIETALGTHYDLTSGTWLAVTFKMTNSSKSLQITKSSSYGETSRNANYICEDITGGGTYVTATYGTNVALKCSTGEYLVPCGGTIVETRSFTTINTGTDPRYIGNKIVTPVNARLCGFNLSYLDMDYDMSVKLVNASGTVLKGDDTTTDMSVSIKGVYRTGTPAYSYAECLFPCPKTLTANTAYYLIFSPDTASNTTIYRFQYETEALKKQDLGIPTGWTLNHVTSPTSVSFTETAAYVSAILPIFDQLYFPDGGSSPRFGDMTGGLR